MEREGSWKKKENERKICVASNHYLPLGEDCMGDYGNVCKRTDSLPHVAGEAGRRGH
jgi:hypothetical protein